MVQSGVTSTGLNLLDELFIGVIGLAIVDQVLAILDAVDEVKRARAGDAAGDLGSIVLSDHDVLTDLVELELSTLAGSHDQVRVTKVGVIELGSLVNDLLFESPHFLEGIDGEDVVALSFE